MRRPVPPMPAIPPAAPALAATPAATTLLAASLLAASLLAACGEPASAPAIAAEVVETPAAVRLTYDGNPVTALESAAGSAFYLFQTGAGGYRTTRLVGAPVRTRDGDSTVLAYDLEDGRKATVTVTPGLPEGSLRVRFAVDRLDEYEYVSADLKVAPDEAFYGLMEKVVSGESTASWRPGITRGLDLRGGEFKLDMLPLVSVYSPSFVSSAGWALWVESDWPGTYRFGVDHLGNPAPEVVQVQYEGTELTLRFIPGPTPMEAVERFARASDTRTLLPPPWAFGPWRWRDDHHDLPAFYDGTPNTTPYNSMVVEDVLMMEALGIPCSVYWVDRPWGPGDFGYDDLEWDPERLPHPREMVRWLGDRGTKFVLWIAPWAVGPTMRAEAEAKGYVTQDEFPFTEPSGRLLDLTNPAAVTWWQDHLQRPLADGVAGFKCDRGDEKPPDGLAQAGEYFDGTSYREGRNAFPFWYARAVHGALERSGQPDGTVSLFRAAWLGSQRHAMVWAGDTGAGELGLRSVIIGVQRAAAMNFPLWGSDTCGYVGQPEHEVCVRWLAFSAFTPLFEVGPTFNAAPWSWSPDGSGKKVRSDGYPYEPVHDETLIAAWSLYAQIHDDLRDYTYDLARAAHEQGTPIVRPMAFAFPGVPEYRDRWDQYLYGPDLLVAPVWRKGTTSREVAIPAGTWRDAWTGDAVTGPTTVTVPAPEHVVPLFVRDGAAVDLGDLDARWRAALARAKVRPDLGTLQQSVALPTE